MAEQEYDAQLIRDISTEKTYEGSTLRRLYGRVLFVGQTVRNIIAATSVTYAGATVRNIIKRYPTKYDDWYLPTVMDLGLIHENLRKNNIGGLDWIYWSSTESSATTAMAVTMDLNYTQGNPLKSFVCKVRKVRHFTTRGTYSIGSTGPAGGHIFREVVVGNLKTYYELGQHEAMHDWSNVVNVAIGNTMSSAGEGYNNSIKIINQTGHTSSAAKQALDYVLPVRLYQAVRSVTKPVTYTGQTIRNIVDLTFAFYRAQLVRRVTLPVSYTGQTKRKTTVLVGYAAQTSRNVLKVMSRVYQTIRNLLAISFAGDEVTAKITEDKYKNEW